VKLKATKPRKGGKWHPSEQCMVAHRRLTNAQEIEVCSLLSPAGMRKILIRITSRTAQKGAPGKLKATKTN